MNMRNIILIIVAVLFVGFILWVAAMGGETPTSQSTDTAGSKTPATNTNPIPSKNMTTATITTNMGVITLELYADQAPKTVENFIKLATNGTYAGTRFHRVIKNFMIQGGDPLSKDLAKQALWGTGGPGYKFNDEIDASSELYKTGYKRGILAMANSGPNTNGSQFFIMHEDNQLPPLYTIFGRVTAGQEVVDTIATTPTGSNDRPVADVVIEKIEIR